MKKRVLYFDLLKIIGSIAVVLIHVISEFWYGLDITSSNFKLLTILDSLCRFCVPIYFMISGAIFLNEEKDITIKDILKKYVLKMLLVFIFWNMIYGVLDIIINQGGTINLSSCLTLLKNTILGKSLYHLSFLVSILGFYLCVPIIRLITKQKNKKILEYLIILLFIFTSLNKLVGGLFSLKLLYPLVFGGYLLYFILGYYLSTFDINKKNTKIIYVLGIISLIFTSIFSVTYSIKIGKPSEMFFDYITPNIVLYSTFIFLLFKNIKIKETKLLTNMSKSYFGVYLMHGLVLGFYLKLGLFSLNLPLGILVLLSTVIIYLTTLIASYIIGLIPIAKKIILR